MQTSLFCRVMAVMLMLCMLAGMVPVIAAETASSVESEFTSLAEEKPETRIPTASDLISRIDGLPIPQSKLHPLTSTSVANNLEGTWFILVKSGSKYYAMDISSNPNTNGNLHRDDKGDTTLMSCFPTAEVTISNNCVSGVSNLNYAITLKKWSGKITQHADWAERVSNERKNTKDDYKNYYPPKPIGTNVEGNHQGYTFLWENGKWRYNNKYLYPGNARAKLTTGTSGYPYFIHYNLADTDSNDFDYVDVKVSGTIYRVNIAGENQYTYWLGRDPDDSGKLTSATRYQLQRNDMKDKDFAMEFHFFRVNPRTLNLYRALTSDAVKNAIKSTSYSTQAHKGFLLSVERAINYYNQNNVYSTTNDAIMKQCNAFADMLTNSVTMLNKESKDKAALNTLSADSGNYMDIPITILDFRADDVMFENKNANDTYYTPYSLGSVDAATDEKQVAYVGLHHPGRNDGSGARVELTMDKLVGGYPVYREETVTYIAKALEKKLHLRDSSYFDTYWNGFINAKAKGGLPTGSWKETMDKVGYNGGILYYRNITTYFDLAYYILNNLWRPVAADDVMGSPQTSASGTSVPQNYNRVVPELHTIRLKKSTTREGFYDFDSSLDVGRDLKQGIIFNTGNNDDGTIPALNVLTDLGFDHPDLYGNDYTAIVSDHNGTSNEKYAARTNYNYGIHAHSAFVYYNDKNLQFTFKGDDDVYFFINGQLVCDVGGMHTAVEKTLTINSVAGKLDLHDGDICTFDMFFIDRHTYEVNLKFSTNIEMMAVAAVTREEQHLYTQPGVMNETIREGAVLESNTEIGYNYMLLNRSDLGANHLTFKDAQLGVTLNKDLIQLNGKAEVGDLILTYRSYDYTSSKFADTVTGTFDYSDVEDSAFADSEFYKLIHDAVHSKSTNMPLKDQVYRITGLTEAKLKALLALGVPANTQIEIFGTHQTAVASAGTCRSSLETLCYPLDLKDEQLSPLSGRDKRSVKVMEQVLFTVDSPLQIVIDYGKSVELSLKDLSRTISTSGSTVASFLGFTTEGEHGLVMASKPSNLKCTQLGETFATDNGIYENLGNTCRFTLSRFLEEVDRANAVYSVSSYNGVDCWYVMVTVEMIPATMVYYEAEDFIDTELTYEELTADGSKEKFDILYQENGNVVSDSVLNSYTNTVDPTNDNSVLYFGFNNTTEDQNRYSKNSIYKTKQYDTTAPWSGSAGHSLNISKGALNYTDIPTDGESWVYLATGTDFSGLSFTPGKEDWFEIRIRINDLTALNDPAVIRFDLELHQQNNKLYKIAHSKKVVEYGSIDTKKYYTIRFPMPTKSGWADTDTRTYLLYGNIGTATRFVFIPTGLKAKTELNFSVDYIYIGPREKLPSCQGGHLMFDFSNTASAQYRYASDTYDGINYALPANWRYTGGRTEAPEILSGALKMTASVDNTENYYWVRTANDEVNNGVKYFPSERDYCQVKLKVENGQPIDPYVAVYFATGPEGIKDKNQESFHFKLTDINGDWVTLSFPIKNSRWYSADVITDLQLMLGGIGSTEGQRVSIYIDYLYIGPAQSQDFSTKSSPDVYGYDTSYTDDRGLSDGKSLFIEGQGIKSAGSATYSMATFTFKGTGFDLISRTGGEQATIRVTAYNTAGEIERYITVNNKGELELYQIPVVSMENLPYGVYTVTVEVNKAQTYSGVLAPLSRGGEFYLDAIRIYDPISTAKNELSEDEETALSAYTDDGEAYPYRKEVRDILLSAEDFDGLTGECDGIVYIDQAEEAPKVTQPDDSADATEYVPTDPETGEPVESLPADPDLDVDNHITGSIATYEKIGPKNEVYLSANQSIAFKLRLNTNEIPISIDVGAKAINAADTPKLAVGHTTTTTAPAGVQAWDVATNTAQYYSTNITAQDFGTDDIGKYLYLVIANRSADTVLSITDLKFGYDAEYTLIQQDNPPVQTPTKGEVAVASPISFTVDRELTRAAYRILSAELPKDDPVVVDETISIAHTLNLASDIAINYVVEKAVIENYDSVVLEVRIPKYEGNLLTGSRTEVLKPVERGNYCYFILDGLTAVHMNDLLEATLKMEKDGTRYMSSTDVYSIATYAYRQISKSSSTASFRRLCADLLRYGSLTQNYKGYRTDHLADQNLTDEQKTYLTDLDGVTLNNNSSVGTELSTPPVIWKGQALDLASKVAVAFIFSIEDDRYAPEDLTLQVRYINSKSEEITAIMEGAQIYSAERGLYQFRFTNLLASELRCVLTVQIFEGETPLSCTKTYSADTYGIGKTGALENLCKALFAYSDSANAFFAS